MTEELIKDHFEKFYKNFYGYGRWDAPYWFIGIEEGGGNKLSHVIQKMKQFFYWSNIEDGLVDNYEFQSSLDEVKEGGFLDCKNPKAQRTWLPPIKALLYALNPKEHYHYKDKEGKLDSGKLLKEAKSYQVENLGRQGCINKKSSCWIELFPLPNPGTTQQKWKERWHKWTQHFEEEYKMPEKRDKYEKKIKDSRISKIQEKIIENKPKNIIAYVGFSNKYRKVIETIVEAVFDTNTFKKNKSDKPIWIENKTTQTNNILKILYTDLIWESSKTRIIITRHPAARWTPDKYWIEVGKLINK